MTPTDPLTSFNIVNSLGEDYRDIVLIIGKRVIIELRSKLEIINENIRKSSFGHFLTANSSRLEVCIFISYTDIVIGFSTKKPKLLVKYNIFIYTYTYV